MEITLFGFLWLSGLVYAFVSKNRMIFMLFLAMVFQSTDVFVLSSGIGVGPQLITSAMYILHILVFLRSFNIKKSKRSLYAILLFCIILLELIINNGLDLKTILYLIQLLIYVICFIFVINNHDKYNYKKIHKYFITIIWFVSIVGIFQFLMSALIIPKFAIFKLLLYNQNGVAETVQFLVERDYWRLFSTFLEPSYCGAFLVASFYYIVSQNNVYQSQKILAVLLFIEIILTGSSTAYGTLIAGGIFFAIYGRNKRLLKILTPIAVVFVIVVLFSGGLEEKIIDKLSSSSGLERAKWNRIALESFADGNYWLGLGYKKIRASSFVISLLAQIGVAGTAFYVKMILSNIVDKKSYDASDIARKISLLCVITSQVISCPDLDFCVFWLFMYLIAFNGVKKNKEGEMVN